MKLCKLFKHHSPSQDLHFSNKHYLELAALRGFYDVPTNILCKDSCWTLSTVLLHILVSPLGE